MDALSKLVGWKRSGTQETKVDTESAETKVDTESAVEKTSTDDKVNPSFLCPISKKLMTDPVMAMDGFSYERSAIEKWLESSSTSPSTNAPLPAKTLIPNISLKTQIAEALKAIAAQVQSESENLQCSAPRTVPLAQSSDIPQAGPPAVLDIYAGQNDEEKVQETRNVLKKDELDVTATGDDGLVKISVFAGEAELKDCPAVDLILVMDRSGSMGTAVVGVDDETKLVVENGFSILDLVKHAMRTCVRSMRPIDRLGLILFDDRITVSFGLTKMDKPGVNMAIQRINRVVKAGSTNIYQSVERAVSLIRNRNDKSRNPAVLFFTDGLPNVSPQMGELNFFRNLMKREELSFPVHTFGFGAWQNINSDLLYSMAKIFNGMYGYIPDATFVGTTFVNAISNILTTSAIHAKVHIVLNGSNMIKKVHVGDFNYERSGNTLVVNVGSVRYGQSIDFLMEFSAEQSGGLEYFVTYERCGDMHKSKPKSWISKGPSPQDHLVRFETIEVLKRVVGQYRLNMHQSKKQIEEHIVKCANLKLQDKMTIGIIENLKGQNLTMLKKAKYMDKWGKHQCRQYIRALNLQIKNNFKDPGVQHFGGKVFVELSDQIDDIFNNMPPPKPSLATTATKVVATPQSFARAYNNVRNDYINGHGCSGGCFEGRGEVTMADGSTKYVREVSPGDLIATPVGAREVYLVRRDELKHAGCLINGLWLTPKHPIRMEGKWVCPGMIQEVDHYCPVTTWFNFELIDGNSFFINGMELVALGHDNVISPEDPAFCPEKDSLYGRGWKSNPERLMYLGENYSKMPKAGRVDRLGEGESDCLFELF